MKRIGLTLSLMIAAPPCVFGAGAFAARAGDLAGTAWRLEAIRSTDGGVAMPGDGSAYRLEFRTDGTAALTADCNRGAGRWTAGPGDALRFGPIAATRATCPPGSLSDLYLQQFEAVRSFVVEDGRLRLAATPDGAVIEFAPDPGARVTATLLGEDLRIADPDALRAAVLGPLLDLHAADLGIEVAPEEVAALRDALRRGKAAAGMTAQSDLTAAEAAEVEAVERAMAVHMIRRWKVSKALHARYGGRIAYQQLGPEPMDAYLMFLEARRDAGAFRILDPALDDDFRLYFTDDARHDYMRAGGADEAAAFDTPPWLRAP